MALKHKKWFYENWNYRHPRTANEKRHAYGNWNRPRREVKTLPDLWDDCFVEKHKSWKYRTKRRYQWDNPRKQKNV